MPAPILTLVQDAADDLGLTRPFALFAYSDEGDTSDRKLLRALVRTCTTLAARHDWQALQARHQWTATATVLQAGALPVDYLRMVPGTFWAETRRLEVIWPVLASDWHAHEAGISPITTPSAIQEGNTIKVLPQPAAGEIFAFRYIRNRIGMAADGTTPRARFAADNDVAVFDDELVTLGIILHYRKIERLDSAADEVTWERMISDRIKADGGSRTFNMVGGTRFNDASGRLDRMKNAAIVVNVS